MFDVGLIVLREVGVYIRRESGAARVLGEEGEREEVMRVQSRLRSGIIPSITETRSLRQHSATGAPPASISVRARLL